MIVSRRALAPIDFHGLEILDYTAREKLGSSFAVIDVPADAKHPEAFSLRSDKYYFVVQGSLEFTLNDERFDLESNDLCIVPKGKKFSYSNRTAAPARVILVHTPSFETESEKFVEENLA